MPAAVGCALMQGQSTGVGGGGEGGTDGGGFDGGCTGGCVGGGGEGAHMGWTSRQQLSGHDATRWAMRSGVSMGG